MSPAAIGAGSVWPRLIAWLAFCLTLPVTQTGWAAEGTQTPAAFAGIGVSLRTEEDGAPYRTVFEVLPGGAAAKSGIRAGDRIVAILDESGNPVSFQGMRTSDVVALIRGRSGTTVRLVVESQGSDRRKLFELVRGTISAAEGAQTPAAFAGIGISIRTEEDGAPYRTVVEVLPGGAAAKSGIRAGDRIVAILDESGNPVSFQGMLTSDVVALIRGRSGTTVRLVMESQGSDRRKLFELVRETIVSP